MVAAIAGAFIIAAFPVLAHLWWMERAGSLMDRYIVTDEPAALTEAGALLGMWSGGDGARAAVPPPVPGSRDDAPLYWRTFGAVAARAPSEEAFALLLGARDRGRLDRLGRIWLGEVAAATGHWDVADEAYGSIDAVNLLADRGDEAAAAGDTQAAAHWYGAAAASLEADERRPVTPGRALADDAGLGPGATRAVLLLRVGRGLLLVGSLDAARTVLEEAESEMHAHPPGLRDGQSIRFALAEALARSLGTGAEEEGPIRARVSTLIARALETSDSGWARLQEARLRLLLGERREAVAALRLSLERDPGSPEPYLVLGTLLEGDGLASLARDLYGRGLQEVPDHPELSAAWAKASFKTLSPAAALPRLQDAARTDTRDPYLFAALGDCHLALGDPAAARAAYREGLRRAPGAPPLTGRLARFARPTGIIF